MKTELSAHQASGGRQACRAPGGQNKLEGNGRRPRPHGHEEKAEKHAPRSGHSVATGTETWPLLGKTPKPQNRTGKQPRRRRRRPWADGTRPPASGTAGDTQMFEDAARDRWGSPNTRGSEKWNDHQERAL